MKMKRALWLLISAFVVLAAGTVAHAGEQNAFQSQCVGTLKAQRYNSKGTITWPDQQIVDACARLTVPAAGVVWANVKTCIAVTGVDGPYLYDITLQSCVTDPGYYKKTACYQAAKGKGNYAWTDGDMARVCVLNAGKNLSNWASAIDCMAEVSPGKFSSTVLGSCKKKPAVMQSCVGALKAQRDASNKVITWPDQQIVDACAGLTVPAGTVQWAGVRTCLAATGVAPSYLYDTTLQPCVTDPVYYEKTPCYKAAKGKGNYAWTDGDMARVCVLNAGKNLSNWASAIDCMAEVSPGEFSSTVLGSCKKKPAVMQSCVGALKAQRDASNKVITWPDQQIVDACAGLTVPAGTVQWAGVRTCLAATGVAPSYLYDITLQPCVTDPVYYEKTPCYKAAKGKGNSAWADGDMARVCTLNAGESLSNWASAIDCMAEVSPGKFDSTVLGMCKSKPISLLACVGALKENRASDKANTWLDQQIVDACVRVTVPAAGVQWANVQKCLKKEGVSTAYLYESALQSCIK